MSQLKINDGGFIEELPGFETETIKVSGCGGCAFVNLSSCESFACTTYRRTDNRDVVFIIKKD